MNNQRPPETVLVPLSSLKPGEHFREHPSFNSPLYEVMKIEEGKIYTQSSVTALAWTTLEQVRVTRELANAIWERDAEFQVAFLGLDAVKQAMYEQSGEPGFTIKVPDNIPAQDIEQFQKDFREWSQTKQRIFPVIPSYSKFKEEYFQEPVIDDIRNTLYPSKFVEEMAERYKVHFDSVRGAESLYWLPINSIPAITLYAYEAGYNQAIRDKHREEKFSQEKLDDIIGVPI